MKKLKNLLTMFAFTGEVHKDDHHSYDKHVEIHKEIELPKRRLNKYI